MKIVKNFGIFFLIFFSFYSRLDAESMNFLKDYSSGFLDGNDLLSQCSDYSTSDAVRCVYYVIGVYDSVDSKKYGWDYFDYPKTCDLEKFPKNIKGVQLTAIVTKYLNDHPEILHYSGARLIQMAISEAWCKTKGKIIDLDKLK